VLVGPDGRGGYRARVVNAPGGEGSQAAFDWPFAELELEDFLRQIGRRRRVAQYPSRRREYRSITVAKYSFPSSVGISVMSPTHLVFGASAVKSR
jgi:hypothetical protein